jgi:Transglutaminase-like superfamily
MNHPTIASIGKFIRLPLKDVLLLLEATLWMTIAGIAVAVLPFRHLGLLASCPVRGPKPTDQARVIMVRRVRWALVTATRRAPWHAWCFQQGVAAQLMLRRRGIPSVLYYGAAQDGTNGLSAHVWVRDGDVDVIGGEMVSHYTVLATFPPNAAREQTLMFCEVQIDDRFDRQCSRHLGMSSRMRQALTVSISVLLEFLSDFAGSRGEGPTYVLAG